MGQGSFPARGRWRTARMGASGSGRPPDSCRSLLSFYSLGPSRLFRANGSRSICRAGEYSPAPNEWESQNSRCAIGSLIQKSCLSMTGSSTRLLDPTTRRRLLPFSDTLVLTGFNVFEGLGIDDPEKVEVAGLRLSCSRPQSERRDLRFRQPAESRFRLARIFEGASFRNAQLDRDFFRRRANFSVRHSTWPS